MSLPNLWVVVTYAPNGVMHTWGPYISVTAAGNHKAHLMRILSHDRGISLRVCRVHDPRPLLAVSSRTTEVSTYDVPESAPERGFSDSPAQASSFTGDTLPGL